jgi:poly-gamma-glutamate capsule biosynthesis protein CapA/YwtB (metallophosphatase superfamily)
VAVALAAAVFACAGAKPASGSDAPPNPGPETLHAPHLPPLRPSLPAPPGIQTLARASISAVGDVLMHGAVKDSAAEHRSPSNDDGFGWLWAPVADLLSSADLTFANLETPLAPRTGQGSRSFVFNARPAVATALRHAGVALVSVANNHMFDQGRPGFEETLAHLDEVGLPYVGAGPEGLQAGPRIVERNGLRIAFLGYARFFNQSGNDCPARPPRSGRPCLKASLLDPERAVSDVKAAARTADAVVVSLHWGDEYQQQPREPDVALAHRLADAGALVVLGHHPHVLQPIELYARSDGRTALIAYSLGNFVSNQSRNYVYGVTPERVAATRDGAILRFEIARRDYGRGVTRVEISRADWVPLWTENDTSEPAERRARGRARPTIQVVSVDRALAAVRAELASLPDSIPPDQEARYVQLRRSEELYLSRRAAIAAVLGEDLRTEAPPLPAAALHGAGLSVPAASP